MSFGMKLVGAQSLLKTLKGYKKDGNFTGFFKLVAAYMLKSINQNFVNEGRPNPWKKSIRALAQKGRTLQDTGILRLAIGTDTSKSKGSSSASGVRRVERTYMEVGVSCPYAAPHQFGYTNAQTGKRVSKRPFLLYQVEDIQFIKSLFTQYFRGSLT